MGAIALLLTPKLGEINIVTTISQLSLFVYYSSGDIRAMTGGRKYRSFFKPAPSMNLISEHSLTQPLI